MKNELLMLNDWWEGFKDGSVGMVRELTLEENEFSEGAMIRISCRQNELENTTLIDMDLATQLICPNQVGYEQGADLRQQIIDKRIQARALQH